MEMTMEPKPVNLQYSYTRAGSDIFPVSCFLMLFM